MNDLRAAHRDGRRTPLIERRPDLPLPFVQVVERALAADPQQRFPSAGALLEALGAVDGSTRLRLRFLVNIGVAAAGTIVALIGLGMLNSRVFNSALERSDFADETVWDWLLWGARSCVGPAIWLAMAFGALGLLVALRRVLIAVSDVARRLDASVRQRLHASAHRLHLDDPSVLGSVLLLLSASALIGAWVHFSPLSAALFSDFSSAPAATLRLIAPMVDGSLNLYNNSYRKTFSWIVILSTLLWYFVLRLSARKGERLHGGLLAGAAATIVLALASLDYPFRLFNNLGTQFDVARWQSADCYILGERRDDVLLFCPALEPTRHRIVKNTDAALQRTGVRESIFTRFSQTP